MINLIVCDWSYSWQQYQPVKFLFLAGSSTNGENKLGVGSSPTTERKETVEKSEESAQSTSMPPPKEPSPGSKRYVSDTLSDLW